MTENTQTYLKNLSEDYHIEEDIDALKKIYSLIESQEDRITIKNYKFKVKENIASGGYIVTEINKLKKPFYIYKPKEIIISGISFTAYNHQSLYTFLEKKNIDKNNIYMEEKPFDVDEIFASKIDSFNFLLKVNRNINIEVYKIIERDLDSNLLSSLVSPEKKYINYSKDSLYFSNSKRNELIQKIFYHVNKKGILFIHGPSGIGKTVTLLYFRYFNINTLYINLKDIFQTFEIKRIFDNIMSELSFLFDNEASFNNYIHKELFPLIQNKVLYDGKDVFCELLAHIIKTMTIINKKIGKLYVIIDQYKLKYDITLKIKNILSNSTKIVPVICSSSNEDNIYNDYYKMLFLDNNINNIIYLSNFGPFDLSLSKHKLNLIKEFGDLPKYMEQIRNLPESEKDINDYRTKNIHIIKEKIANFISNKI